MHWRRSASALILLTALTTPTLAAGGNRLTYLDGNDPYYVSRQFPRLVTPQWVGEDGVEAVVILAIDDMRDPGPYEAFLRPILQRLRHIDGRSPVSIMTCRIDPHHPRLQKWLREGLSLETHTLDHPCPLLQDGNLGRARATYEGCVDLLSAVPHSHPVAFRVPCCDSLNTPSPRFYSEIFNRTTPRGNFLTLDSSVFNLFTADDPDLPRDLVLESSGQERFRKYLPADRSFVNYVEDYPYPYVLGRLCWEFPCVTPSDWEAQHLRGPNHPATVRDWKAALDAVVRKQGTFNLVFHPHGWIRSEQIVDLIDYAVAQYGKKVKFLTFREAQERLNKYLLGGQPLRRADGGDNGVRLLDLDNDGYLDVVIGNDQVRQTRLWRPRERTWTVSGFPVRLVEGGKSGPSSDAGVRFGVVRPDGKASLLMRNQAGGAGFAFDGTRWVEDRALLRGLEVDGRPVWTSRGGRDQGVRLRDLDGDGRCELIVGNDREQAVFAWDPASGWRKLPFTLPAGTTLVDGRGRDRGLRFVDVDEDGHDDVLFSNEQGYSLHLFTSMTRGWSHQVLAGRRGQGKPGAAAPGEAPLPMIARKGTDNGAWFHSRGLWVQNEDTDRLKDHVDCRSFNDLLTGVDPQAKAPEASLHCLKPRPGFVAELVASEPLVQSPIAVAWGPDGKLWVVEMRDYPLGLDGHGKPGGRIKYLEDTDGDGKYDKATIFLDGLPFPTGVLPWRKGVLVTCAPDILYAEDTDGDGKADKVQKLFTGFGQGNPQHRVNGLVWGLDNWIYCANGDSGGRIRSLATGKVVEVRGHDLRIRPDDGDLDLQTGQTQYGRNQDNWGNWFGGNNSNPVWQFVLADHYLRRNPYLVPPDPRVSVPDVPGAAPVFPRSRTLPRFNDPEAANHFTSACSPIVYRDDLFGPAFADSTFVSEPVHNLVHREVLTSTGVTFRSRRAADEQTSEFLSSTDNWFRPTMLRTGPDGALWVVDMYRAVIEHPEWIPLDWQKKLDLRAGADKGRIYRLYPVGARPRPMPRLDRLDTAGLVRALDSPSGWQRDLAQQMLLWRADRGAVPLLEKLATEGKRPLTRLHALCTLDGLKALGPDLLVRALTDAHPGVRRHAVRLCESLLARGARGDGLTPLLESELLQRVHDTDPQVRLQLAYSLGAWDDPRAGQALGRLLVKATEARYQSAAALSSVNKKNLDRVLLAVLEDSKGEPPGGLVEELLKLASALRVDRATVTLLKAVGRPAEDTYAPWQFASLANLLDEFDWRGSSLAQLRRQGDRELKAAVAGLGGLFAAARTRVRDDKAPVADRRAAVRLLGRGVERQKEDVALLAGLLVPQTPEEVQAAAIEALGRLNDRQVPALLLRGWTGYGPGLRPRVLDVLLERRDRVEALLGALEEKQVPPREVDAARRQRLLQYRDKGVRSRAARMFAGAVNPDRQKVIDSYRPALTLRGDPARGRALFVKVCATCHRLEGTGQEVGPDLAGLADKPADYLLTAILDPNRAVEPRYINYLAQTATGRTLTGILASETGSSITLIAPDGKRHTLLRAELESLTSTGQSAMPEGLEKDLKPHDLANLLAYLRSIRRLPKPKEFPGNRPELVRPGPDGTLRLLSSNCAIHGPTLVLEAKYGNLGYWTSTEDRAVWTAAVPRAGKYRVWLEWACDPGNAGNTFLLEAGEGRLTHQVASTGNWDTYQEERVGTLTLTVGEQQIVLRPAGPVSGALLDLKSIRLVPER